MNLLLMLMAYGNEVCPEDDAYLLDFNGNGQIDMYDFLEMLAQQPPLEHQEPCKWNTSPTPSSSRTSR